MTPDSQEIISRMSPIELSMLMDHGAVPPSHLEETKQITQPKGVANER